MKRSLAVIVGLMFCMNVGLLFYKNKFMERAPAPQFSQIRPGDGPPVMSEPLPPDPQPAQPPAPKEAAPDFVEVKVYRKSEEGTVYGDIISHSRGAPFGDAHGRSTNAHETAHGIHSEIRNEYTKSGKKVNGFYALKGRGVVIEEPNIKMSHAVKFIPENLRSYRYDLYMVKQLRDWNDTPTYIMDEWNAYVLGGMCCVDDVRQGKHKGGWTDGVSGCLDFSIYTMALAMAVKEHDKAYWESNTQFKNWVKWNLKRANETYLAGHRMKEFQWEKQDKLLKEFLDSTGGARMREFVKAELDGIWLDAKTIEAAHEDVSYEDNQRDNGEQVSRCHCGENHALTGNRKSGLMFLVVGLKETELAK